MRRALPISSLFPPFFFFLLSSNERNCITRLAAWASTCGLLSVCIQSTANYMYGLTQIHTERHTQWCAGRCRAPPLMPLLPSGPAASWHLSPWRRLIASPALTRGERHAEREKNHLSILSSAHFSDGQPPSHLIHHPPLIFFCPPHPPLSPLLRLLCPSFIKKKTLKMKEGEKKSDRSTVSNLAENVTHA